MCWTGAWSLWRGLSGRGGSQRVPVVLTKAEMERLLAAVPDKYRLFFQLLYGTGMRLMEGLRLRVKDVDFEREPDRGAGRQGDEGPGDDVAGQAAAGTPASIWSG